MQTKRMDVCGNLMHKRTCGGLSLRKSIDVALAHFTNYSPQTSTDFFFNVIFSAEMGLTTVLLILLMAYQSFGVQLSDSDEVERYILEIIKQFEEKPTDIKFSSIIHPPLIRDASSKAAFFMPKILLWSPQEHFSISMKCPIHKKPLRPLRPEKKIIMKPGSYTTFKVMLF